MRPSSRSRGPKPHDRIGGAPEDPGGRGAPRARTPPPQSSRRRPMALCDDRGVHFGHWGDRLQRLRGSGDASCHLEASRLEQTSVASRVGGRPLATLIPKQSSASGRRRMSTLSVSETCSTAMNQHRTRSGSPACARAARNRQQPAAHRTACVSGSPGGRSTGQPLRTISSTRRATATRRTLPPIASVRVSGAQFQHCGEQNGKQIERNWQKLRRRNPCKSKG
jgi:hypothetical protein